MTARGLIVAAPRSGAGKTTSRSRCSRRSGGEGSRFGPPKPGPIISTLPFMRRRPGGQASISTAGRCRPRCSMRSWATRIGCRDAGDRRRHGAVRRDRAGAAAGADRPPTSPRASACPFCWWSTCRGNRNRPRPWCAASPRMIRRSGSAASCSTAWAASGIGRLVSGAVAALGIPILGSMPRDESLVAARAPSRPGAGDRARRSRRAARASGGARRASSRSRRHRGARSTASRRSG